MPSLQRGLREDNLDGEVVVYASMNMDTSHKEWYVRKFAQRRVFVFYSYEILKQPLNFIHVMLLKLLAAITKEL
jgi:hypothetical protein